MYGSAVLVQPVVQPVAADTNLTAHYLHFPHLPMPARRARLPASRRQQAGSKQAARQRAAGRQQRAGRQQAVRQQAASSEQGTDTATVAAAAGHCARALGPCPLHPGGPGMQGGAADVWVERGSGACFRGGDTLTLGYRLEETAEFIRAGSVLPMARTPPLPRPPTSPLHPLARALLPRAPRRRPCPPPTTACKSIFDFVRRSTGNALAQNRTSWCRSPAAHGQYFQW